MYRVLFALAIACGSFIGLTSVSKAATEPEKAFVETYKKAFEGGDANTLKSLLYTKGADPMVLEFYTMMMTAEMGAKISSIQLNDLTAEDKKKANEIQPLPSGENAKLPVEPSKKLVLKVESKSETGTSTSSSESFVALIDGKYMIPVPGPVKK